VQTVITCGITSHTQAPHSGGGFGEFHSSRRCPPGAGTGDPPPGEAAGHNRGTAESRAPKIAITNAKGPPNSPRS
jgi:hypothetical protein